MKSILSNTMQSYDVFFNPAILVPEKSAKFQRLHEQGRLYWRE